MHAPPERGEAADASPSIVSPRADTPEITANRLILVILWLISLGLATGVLVVAYTRR